VQLQTQEHFPFSHSDAQLVSRTGGKDRRKTAGRREEETGREAAAHGRGSGNPAAGSKN
jgi:hypothetical protein